MNLNKVIIKNYRQFKYEILDFHKNITVLAGANNCGKTSLINLISIVLTGDKERYCVSDIPVMDVINWVGKIYPLFEKAFTISDKEELIFKTIDEEILLDEKIKELKIPSTCIDFSINYNPVSDDIRNFVDYLMDLELDKHSFYFRYIYELNKVTFGKIIKENSSILKSRFLSITNRKGDCVNQVKNLKNFILKLYVTSIEPKCYFCDKSFSIQSSFPDVKTFRSLFHFKYIHASRPLDDGPDIGKHLISSQMIDIANENQDWKNLLMDLPEKLLEPIQNREIEQKIRDTSLSSVDETLQKISETNGNHTNLLMLNIDVDEQSITDFLKETMAAVYDIKGYYLDESSQGLGYSNLIYMHLQLDKFKRQIDNLCVNFFVIEEAESHMHPQMQNAFISYLVKDFSKESMQGLLTTHSTEIVKGVTFRSIRIIRQTEQFRSGISNFPSIISETQKKTQEPFKLQLKKIKEEIVSEVPEDEDVNIKRLEEIANLEQNIDTVENFYSFFTEIGYSEVIFADKAILFEGDTERLYLKNLLTLEKYKKLSLQYIAFIQVGGAYAYNYKDLLNAIGIKTLIITDIDYSKTAIDKDQIMDSFSSNSTINNFYNDKYGCKKPKISDLYQWQNEIDKNILADELAKVKGTNFMLTYQTEKDNYGRTLEESMIGKLLNITPQDFFTRNVWKEYKKKHNLKFAIPTLSTKTADLDNISIRNILKSSSNSKTDFMYSVILNGIGESMEPNYISRGLKWLMK